MRDVRLDGSDREDGRSDSGLTRRDLLRLFAGTAGASVLAGCAGRNLWRSRPHLVVWSCGGNYESLLDFNRHFEDLIGCRITYSSAPVEHLISILASRPRGVDILVGRSGPGWFDLSDRGRLAGKPEVFALDPYVIIVPPGNPGNVRGLEDLKRPDVKTVYAPTSSGPSGKVVQIILQTADEVIEPGIWAGYVRNAIEAHDCGWKVFPPVIEGRAHASVTRLSMTTVAENKGKVEVVPVPVKVMASMKEGHGAIPQRAAPIAESKHLELAKRYIDGLKGELGLEVCQRHGYIHRLAPEAERYKPLFKMRVGGEGRKGGPQRSEAGPTQHPPTARGQGRQNR